MDTIAARLGLARLGEAWRGMARQGAHDEHPEPLSPDEERAVREHLDRVMADLDDTENMRAWAWGK